MSTGPVSAWTVTPVIDVAGLLAKLSLVLFAMHLFARVICKGLGQGPGSLCLSY